MTVTEIRPHRGPFKFNLRQSRLEAARGAVMAAATAYGDSPTAETLWCIAQELTALRDPDVTAFYERKRLRQIQSGMKEEIGDV